ncbi:MAG: hypothetical protein WC758_07830 [Candidatus Woesearchaeota archaeon]|jgi:hypothetical protein
MGKSNILVYVVIGIIAVLFLSNLNFIPKEESGIKAFFYDSNGNQVDFNPYNYTEAMKNTNKEGFSIFKLFSISGAPETKSEVVSYDSQGNLISSDNKEITEKNGVKLINTKYSSTEQVNSDKLFGLFSFVTNTYTVDIPISDSFTVQNQFNTYTENNNVRSASYKSPYSGSFYYNKIVYSWDSATLKSYIPEGATIISDPIFHFYVEPSYRSLIMGVYPLPNGNNYRGNPSYAWTLLSRGYPTFGCIYGCSVPPAGWNTFSNLYRPNRNYSYSFGFAENYDQSGTSETRTNIYNVPYLTITYTTQTCNPESCSTQGKTCGIWSDTCSAVLDCGTAPSGYYCNSTGQTAILPTLKLQLIMTNDGSVPLKDVTIFENKLVWTNLGNSNTGNLYSFPSLNYTINPGQVVKVNTSLMNIDPSWIGNQVKFISYVYANNTYTGGYLEKIATPLTLQF